MSGFSFEIYKVNKKLSQSVQEKAWFYAFSVGLSCLILISVITIDFFIKTPNVTSFLILVLTIVFFDLIFIILRFQSRSFIEPYHLELFPISRWKKFLFHVGIFLFDYKSLIYFFAMSCFALLFIKYSLYSAVIFSAFFWTLLWIIVLAWTAVIYGLFDRYLDKMGNKIQYMGLFFIAILLWMQHFDNDFFEKIPVVKQTGNALYGLWINSPVLVWNNLLYLLGSLALPLLFLFGISRFNNS